MPVLYVNAYPLMFEGTVSLWRIARAATDDKRTREAELGMALWGERDAFWSAREPQGERATEETFPAAQPQGRVVFAAREALVGHAHAGGRDAWFGRGGEMSFLGLLPSQDSDRFVLEPQLVVRLVQETYIGADAAAVVRARTRWRSKDTLDSAEIARIAVGEPAVRLSGSGPRRSYCQMLWMSWRENAQTATFSSMLLLSWSSSVTRSPSLKTAPLRTSAISSWPLKRRQRCCAASSSL